MPVTHLPQLSEISKSINALRFTFQHVFKRAPLHFALLIILGILPGLFPPLQAYALAMLISTVQTMTQTSTVQTAQHWSLSILQPFTLPLSLILGTLIVKNIIVAIQPYIGELFRERVEHAYYRDFYVQFLNLSLEDFEKKETFDLGHNAMITAWETTMFWKYDLQGFLTNLVSIISIIALFSINGYWYIAFILLLGNIPGLIIHIISTDEEIRVHHQHSMERRQVDYWQDLLTKRESASEVRLYALQYYLRERWRDLKLHLVQAQTNVRQRLLKRSILPGAIHYTVVGASLLLLFYAAWQGHINSALFVALIFTLQQYNSAMSDFTGELYYLLQKISKMQFIEDFLKVPTQDFRVQGLPAPRLKQGITLEHVSFTYPGSTQPVLRDVSLHIKPGERIALVGENGAGKSTLAKLLLSLYTPTSGRILLDGQDLQATNLSEWRASVGAVFQDFVCYSFTARENIGFGNVAQIDDLEAIQRAATLSSANTYLEQFPQQYETLLGKEFEGGQDLSYGQWQKIAIARAYMRDAQLLILDEPASALDARSEFDVYRQFRDIAEGRSIVLISHRLGSARLADRILFLADGCVSEEGTHEELLAQNDTYAKLYTMQAEWYREQTNTTEKEHIHEV